MRSGQGPGRASSDSPVRGLTARRVPECYTAATETRRREESESPSCPRSRARRSNERNFFCLQGSVWVMLVRVAAGPPGGIVMQETPAKPQHPIFTRREMLQAGSIGLMGLSLADLETA